MPYPPSSASTRPRSNRETLDANAQPTPIAASPVSMQTTPTRSAPVVVRARAGPPARGHVPQRERDRSALPPDLQDIVLFVRRIVDGTCGNFTAFIGGVLRFLRGEPQPFRGAAAHGAAVKLLNPPPTARAHSFASDRASPATASLLHRHHHHLQFHHHQLAPGRRVRASVSSSALRLPAAPLSPQSPTQRQHLQPQTRAEMEHQPGTVRQTGEEEERLGWRRKMDGRGKAVVRRSMQMLGAIEGGGEGTVSAVEPQGRERRPARGSWPGQRRRMGMDGVRWMRGRSGRAGEETGLQEQVHGVEEVDEEERGKEDEIGQAFLQAHSFGNDGSVPAQVASNFNSMNPGLPSSLKQQGRERRPGGVQKRTRFENV